MASELKPFGYAPGSYMNNCKSCSQSFMGDKRAWNCEPCAKALSLQTATPVAPVSPDAVGKCGELETAEYQFKPGGNDYWTNTTAHNFPGYKAKGWQTRELVTRSQAEAIIAEERAEKEIAERNRDAARENFLTMQKSAAKLLERAEKAEADNAALTTRVKELEATTRDDMLFSKDQAAKIEALQDERAMIVSHATMGGTDGVGLNVNDISVRVTALRNELYNEGNNRSKALETQLAAARKALEPFSKFAGALFERNFNDPEVVDRISAADGGVLQLTAKDFFEARAALEASHGQ